MAELTSTKIYGSLSVTTLDGIAIGNGSGNFTAVSSSTAEQLLRRNEANNGYEFWTPTYTSNTGTVTSVSAGNGMNFTAITESGSVTMGTPSDITLLSTSSVTPTSHTHAFAPGGQTTQYIDGTGSLQTFPTTLAPTNHDINGTVHTGILNVSKGGTGRSTLTSGSVLVGNGTSAVSLVNRSGIDTRSTFPPSSHSLTSHSDVDVNNPVNGQLLAFDGNVWFPFTPSYTSNTGTVETVNSGTGLTGGPIQTTGELSLTGQALALHNFTTNGLITRTGASAYAGRTITGSTGISVSNGNGVNGNPSITNTDRGSSQSIFKIIYEFDTAATISASTNNDSLLLRGVGATQVRFDTSENRIDIESNDTTYSVGDGLASSGTVFSLGGPSSITLNSTNSVDTSTHSHAFAPGGTTAQYIRGDGTLATFAHSHATLSAGTGITGLSYNGSTARTWNLDTTWLNNNYVNISGTQSITGSKTFTQDVGIGTPTNNISEPLHVRKSVINTNGTNGTFIRIDNQHNLSNYMCGILFRNHSNESTLPKGGLFFNHSAGWGRGDFYFALNDTGNANQVQRSDAKMILRRTGDLEVVGEVTAYSSSDKRLKENISPINNSLSIIDKLNPVTFNWNDNAKELSKHKDTNETQYGLIAQELEEVLPEIVHDMYDGKYKGVDYEKLLPILLASIKELKEEIRKINEKL